MTATLPEYLNAAAVHMDVVRGEYALTKADHARPDGCDDCGQGLDPDRGSGWEFDHIANILLCGRCVKELMRYEAQMAGAAKRTSCSKGLHDMTDDANHYWTLNGRKARVLRCRSCYTDMNRARKKRKRDRVRGEA